MSDDVRDEPLPVSSDSIEPSPSVDGPLRPFAFGRRAILQSLATGVGAAVLATPASAHVHQAATAAAKPAAATAAGRGAAPALVFLDKHAFDTLAILGEQIVPGSRAAKVPEFLDRLLAVESTDTQKRVIQSIGAFEREARDAHGKPWKSLTAPQATAILTKMSDAPGSEATRRAFEVVKGVVAETFYASEAGVKELGWNRGVMFASPIACG
ncbi:MAG: gluconate 2-dehydrogenase subunit 3 family protein [Vicinamibacteraceae bacterium]